MLWCRSLPRTPAPPACRPRWHVVEEGKKLQRHFTCKNFAAALAAVNGFGAVAEEQGVRAACCGGAGPAASHTAHAPPCTAPP